MLYFSQTEILAVTNATIALIMKILPSLTSKIISKAKAQSCLTNLSESNVKFR